MNRGLNDKGSSMVSVLVLLFMLGMLTAATLTAAAGSARQSKFSEQYERAYYGAESALHIATSAFEERLTFEPSAIADNEADAETLLLANLQIAVDVAEAAAQSVVDKYNDENETPATVEIKCDLSNAPILTMPNALNDSGNATEYISFFGETINGDGSVASVTPFELTITARYENRAVELSRSFSIAGGQFTESVAGTPDTPGEGGGGFWLAGSNLISNGAGWSSAITSNNGVNVSTGMGADEYTYIASPSGNIPGRGDLNGLIGAAGGHIVISQDVTRIKNEVFTIIKAYNPGVTGTNTLSTPSGATSTTVPVRYYMWDQTSDSSPLTPANLTGVQTLWSNGAPLYLRGDFPDLRVIYCPGNVTLAGNFPNLEAVYAAGLNLGNSSRGFECDRSAEIKPLYIYSGSNNNPVFDFSQGATIKNAEIIVGNTLTIKGDTDKAIQCDAQFYCSNTITIDLNVPNWDASYVPTFITNNDIKITVKAEKGFSGIFYSGLNTTVNIDAPFYNGAFLTKGGFHTLALKNSFTSDPVDFYCLINQNAYDHLHATLKAYFNALLENPDAGGGSGGGVIAGAPGVDAEYVIIGDDGNPIETELTGKDVANPATIREVDVET